jgi:hypothetical protein
MGGGGRTSRERNVFTLQSECEIRIIVEAEERICQSGSGWSSVQSRSKMNRSFRSKVRKLPNYSIKRVESVKRAILGRPGRRQTCAVCSQKSKRPRKLNFCSNSSFRLGDTSSPRQRNDTLAFRRRLNESFDRHLLLEQGRAVEPYEWIKLTSTYFSCWFRSPSLI